MARAYVPRKIWLPVFFGKVTFLLFAVSLETFYFYIAGNIQGFTDKTLLFLFSVESVILIIGFFSGVFASFSYMVTIPFRNRLHLDKIILSGAASVFSLFFYTIITLLQAFMRPYG